MPFCVKKRAGPNIEVRASDRYMVYLPSALPSRSTICAPAGGWVLGFWLVA